MSLHAAGSERDEEVRADRRNRRFAERIAVRLAAAGTASAVAGLLVYAAFVRTAAGQRWENAVWAGRAQDESLAALHRADRVLDHITLMSLAGAVAVVVLIGAVRRCHAATAAAVGVVGCSLVLSEVLKRLVLGRPDLVGASPRLLDNSFPSGHTAIAMSVVFGLALVVPYRLRAAAVGVCAVWASFVGAYTVAAGWHRPSDVIGADLLVLAVTCGCASVLARFGGVRAASGRRHRAGALLVTGPLMFVALTGLGTGGILLAGAVSGAVPAWSAPGVAYTAGHALAAGAGAATSLVWLGLLRRCEVCAH
ncbi:phosphatase PAP2 family protein [Streptomyces sp. Act143]|uniref:phosphatase PAP2 family protein n=1 Tax=Streptomyces sp. Act143 TaxID=2200760 RepID=UPI00215B1727|nr:phosphatase PAP2 family protein [Streptomyces sp. Act143]